jgi:hypothetical protein
MSLVHECMQTFYYFLVDRMIRSLSHFIVSLTSCGFRNLPIVFLVHSANLGDTGLQQYNFNALVHRSQEVTLSQRMYQEAISGPEHIRKDGIRHDCGERKVRKPGICPSLLIQKLDWL